MRLGRLFSSELGDNPYVPMKKEWIATAIGVVGGLASSALVCHNQFSFVV